MLRLFKAFFSDPARTADRERSGKEMGEPSGSVWRLLQDGLDVCCAGILYLVVFMGSDGGGQVLELLAGGALALAVAEDGEGDSGAEVVEIGAGGDDGGNVRFSGLDRLGDGAFEGLLAGKPSGESQSSFAKWLQGRKPRRPKRSS